MKTIKIKLRAVMQTDLAWVGRVAVPDDATMQEINDLAYEHHNNGMFAVDGGQFFEEGLGSWIRGDVVVSVCDEDDPDAEVFVRNWCGDLTEKTDISLSQYKDLIESGPVYYWYSSTDCDHTHVEYAVKYANEFEAMMKMNATYASAEGPTHFRKITAEEYDQEKGNTVMRDLALEAHENGHPHLITSTGE